MSRDQLIKKNPELFISIIKEGIELALHGHTDVSSVNDVKIANNIIKKKKEYWEALEGNIHELI